MTSPLRGLVTVFFKGAAMGAADAVPGVSGGTIALITGIYERLVAALTAIEPSKIRRVISGVDPRNLPDAQAAFLEMDGPFLLALGAGILTAVVTVLRAVVFLLDTVPVATFAFFFGLIGASAVVLFADLSLDTRGRKAAAVAGFLVAFVLSGEAAGTAGNGSVVVFVAGAIAVSAMVLPGVSGSLLLILLGQYEYMSRALEGFVDALLAVGFGGSSDAVLEAAPPVGIFLAGAVVGLFTVAHGVRFALARYRRATFAFLVALVAGALRAPVVQATLALEETGRTWSLSVIATFLGAAAVGAAVVFVLDHYAGVMDYYEEDPTAAGT